MARPRFGDLELKETVALSNGAGTVKGAGIRVGCGTPDDFPLNCEFKITAPALTTTLLPDTETMKYSLITADTDTFDDDGTLAVLLPDVITQTGAGGAGAAEKSWQGRAPIGGMRAYVGLRVVKTGTGNASAVSATLEMLV